MRLGIDGDTFAKLQRTKAEAVDCDSPDGMATLCPRCMSRRARKVNGWVEYECGASVGVGLVGSDFCFRRAFDVQKQRVAKLEAENKDLRDRVAELEARCKLLELAGDNLDLSIACGCGVDGPCQMCRRASDSWLQAKEAKP